ncbi:electron transfer flavoprotein subunit beta/FixA family protein [Paraburkholderia dipogonis]|uniref:Electron transfer flavoprotein subunit beta/FixA family protein n=1 Tax=Paraburkholderia dipogonis TaxID=1211383 RepID=A0A4Y8ML59_9BURK|nr:electron transfer flavoprotein subunit beta/FixA family protein [Paraburkholderia dipogonis]TFE38083.1 electron transfer flavoprotein subunit beta/FixA family protein [Paraburkholderia dipogonis]
MKIATFVKHVPVSAVTPKISASRDRIEDENLAHEVNETDLYAIEEAVHQRTQHQGSAIAITIGVPRAKEALHVAYARGVDQAIHVVDDTHRGGNSVVSAAAAAAVVKDLNCDAIFTGIQADDDLLGGFGIALAESLGLPVVTAVTGITFDPANKRATVIRELGAGFKEELEVDLPCVFTIQFGIRPVRYLPVMAVVKARTKKIDALSLDSLNLAVDAESAKRKLRVLEFARPESRGKCEMIEGEAADAVKQLVEALVQRGVI